MAYGLGVQAPQFGQYGGLLFWVMSGTNGANDVTERMHAFITQWVNEELPKRTQLDIDMVMNPILESDDVEDDTVTHNMALNKFVFQPENWADAKDFKGFTIEELVEFARLHLVESPEGILVKVKTDMDKPAIPQGAVLHMGGK
jgi:hypothetical protein